MDQDNSTPQKNAEIIDIGSSEGKRGSSAAENRQKDAARARSVVSSLWKKFTGTRESDNKVKDPSEVMLVTAGMVPADTRPIVPTETAASAPTVFEPITASNTEKEDMATAIAVGPTSPTESREAQIAAEEAAKAKARQEEAKRNERVAGDPTVYRAFQDDQQELQHNAFNPTSWMEREANDTQNLKRGTAEADIAAKAARGELDADGVRAELFKTGNYENLEAVDSAAQKIEAQNSKDRKATEPIFDEDLSPSPRLETSDRNPSVIGAEADVAGHLGMMERNRQMDKSDAAAAKNDRELAGEGWKAAHLDNESTTRLEDSDQNQSVLDAEAEVERQKRVNEYERKKAEVEAAEAQADREASGRSWIDAHRDNASNQRLEYGDNNPSVQAAAQEVQDYFTKQREDQELKDYDIGETGKRWSALDDLDKPAPIPSSRNQSVLDAEADVAGHLGMMERNRQMDEADAAAARAERERTGERWRDIHGDDRVEGRLAESDNNPSVIAAEREVTGPLGVNRRREIADDLSEGVDNIADRIDTPIADGEIVVRRRQPLLAEPDTAPEVTEQRQRTTERVRRTGPRWRRALALGGLIALVGLIPDRGPVNPVAEPGQPLINEAPFVPMPEIGNKPEFSPLDGLPKMLATFPTEGPSGEKIPTTQADLGEWFNAQWVKQYKQAHPGQFNDNGFDMRSAYDINLLNRLKHSESYQKARGLYSEYIATHEIRNGDQTSRVDVQRDADGKVTGMLVSVPKQGGYSVPDVKSVYDLVNK